jgi:hypothetical protein
MSTCMLAGCCVGGGEDSGVAVEAGGSIYGVVADKAADGALLSAIGVGADVDEGGDTAAEAENGTTVDAGGGGVARPVFFGAAGAEAARDAMAASAGRSGPRQVLQTLPTIPRIVPKMPEVLVPRMLSPLSRLLVTPTGG